MLAYLVTSRTRREILRLLWIEGGEASVSDLARRAGVRYAAAHREVVRMAAAGLALSRMAGPRRLLRANPAFPHGPLLRALLGGRADAPAAPDQDRLVRTRLAAAGAPLLAAAPAPPEPDLEAVLADALQLSHRDATVARVLPVVLWRQRAAIDHGRLERECARRGEMRALGLFLELTARLAGDRRLLARARRFQPAATSRPRYFFGPPRGRYARALARAQTPPVVRRWGYLMNMGLDSFRSTFGKHAAVS